MPVQQAAVRPLPGECSERPVRERNETRDCFAKVLRSGPLTPSYSWKSELPSPARGAGAITPVESAA